MGRVLLCVKLCMLMCMECVVLWVAAMQLLLSMAGIVCLVRRNYEQCWVCMVCWEFKLFCKILLLMNVADMDCLYVEGCGGSSAEYQFI